MFARSKHLADEATRTLGMIAATMPAIHDAAEEGQHLSEVLRETADDTRKALTATGIGVTVLACVAVGALLIAAVALILAIED